VDRESVTIVVYCQIDTVLAEMAADPEWRRIRQRGPAPVLADAEVLTMAVVGEFLGLDQDAAIYRSFRGAHPDWFPTLMRLHRTTFARQAANVWVVTEQLWQRLRDRVAHDPTLSCIDRGPIPVCRFGRAYRCARFRGQAAFGRDPGSKAPFSGFRQHLRICWPGVVTAGSVAPANGHDLELVPEVVEGATGGVLGDRHDWGPKRTADLLPAGIRLLAPFTKRATDPDPGWQHPRDPRALADGDRGRPIRGTLPPQAPLGAGPLASDQLPLAQGAPSHPRRRALSGAAGATAAVRPPRGLACKLAHRVSSYPLSAFS
jgi:hypothetical protein